MQGILRNNNYFYTTAINFTQEQFVVQNVSASMLFQQNNKDSNNSNKKFKSITS